MNINEKSLQKKEYYGLYSLGVAIWLFLFVYYRVIGYDVAFSDPIEYYNTSLSWWVYESYNGAHVPLYPMLIWLFRTVTFGLLSPAILMQIITFSAWSIGFWFMVGVFSNYCKESRKLGVALFAMFPMMSIPYAVYPNSDNVSYAAMAAALYFFFKRSWWPYTIAVALALISHKGAWPYMAFLSAYAMIKHRYPWWMILVSGIPLSSFLIWRIIEGSRAMWAFAGHARIEWSSDSSLPVFAGIAEAFNTGMSRTPALLKGILALILLIVELFMIVYYAIKRRLFPIVLIAPSLIFLAIMNEIALFEAIRFSRIVAIPIALLLCSSPILAKIVKNKIVFTAILILLSVVQLSFGLYMPSFKHNNSRRPTYKPTTEEVKTLSMVEFVVVEEQEYQMCGSTASKEELW